MNTPITISLQRPIMEEVKVYKRFDKLPPSEQEWFYDHKSHYIAQVKKEDERLTFYKERRAIKLFIEEYNEQLQSRAKRRYEITLAQYEKQMEIQSLLGFHAVKVKEYSKCKTHCSNNYTNYFFSRPITKKEFISFLEKMGKEIIQSLNWWDDCTIITGGRDEWTYIHSKPYLKPFVDG